MSTRVQELFDRGAQFGYSKTRRHPSTIPYIYTSKNRGDIINLEKTVEQLEAAEEYMKGLAAQGKTILFVGTKPEIRDIVVNVADALNMPYVDERWIGGTLTNFKEIRKRTDRLMDLEYKKEHNELVFQTKKEGLMIEREIIKLKKNFGGITSLKGMPDAIVLVDSLHEDIATKEATVLGIPLVAITNTDCNINPIAYPVVANDATRPSVEYTVHALRDAYSSGK